MFNAFYNKGGLRVVVSRQGLIHPRAKYFKKGLSQGPSIHSCYTHSASCFKVTLLYLRISFTLLIHFFRGQPLFSHMHFTSLTPKYFSPYYFYLVFFMCLYLIIFLSFIISLYPLRTLRSPLIFYFVSITFLYFILL